MPIAFEPLSARHRPMLEKHLPQFGSGDCNLSVVSLLTRGVERGIRAAECREHLLLETEVLSAPGRVLILPVGSNITAELLNTLEAHYAAEGLPLRLFGIVPEVLRMLKRTMPERSFNVTASTGDWDYVYRRERIETLEGRAMAKKRNLAKRYRSTVPGAIFRPFVKPDGTPDAMVFERALEFLEIWYRDAVGEAGMTPSLLEEQGTVRRALNLDFAGELLGGVLFSDDSAAARVDGFSYGACVRPGMAAVHIEKARREPGAYPALSSAFAASLPADIKLINREEDLNIAGLRRAKLQWAPSAQLQKGVVELLPTA